MKKIISCIIVGLLASLNILAQNTQPNILLIITDQHSGLVMSQQGYEHIKTPGIDKLAEQGVTFTRSYCTYPVCTASRKSFMTGMMPSQIKNITDYPAIGKELATVGYETVYYGKWHVGSTKIDDVKDWHGFKIYEDSHDDTEISKWSTDFIKQTHTKPFFMITSFMNPHDACELARNLSGDNDNYNDGDVGALTVDINLCPPLPSNFAIPPNEAEGFSGRRNQDPEDNYYNTNPYKLWTETEWRRYIYGYDRFVEKVDAHIEEVYDALEAEGLLENTIIIYTADHGDGHGSHQWTQKKTFYEETINVPFIISWKGKTKTGVIDNSTLISNGLDIVPTILDLAGINIPSRLPGANVMPNALQNPGSNPIVDRDYIVSEIDQKVYKSNTPGSFNGRMVVTKNFKYILFDKGANNEQLFDLVKDPGELNPVTDNPAYHDELIACREMLKEWVTNTGDDFDVDTAINTQKYNARRLNNGQPIITQKMFTDAGVEDEGRNLNGPCMIRIPDWIAPENRANPEAKYYCYFAHHSDEYIRMAWAANIEGPWHLYQIGSNIALGDRGVLDNGNKDIVLGNGIVIENNHLASPNAHVDHENQRIILYFHSGSSTFVNGEEVKSQLSYVSYSPYGLDFYDNIQPVFLGGSYFSVFEYGDHLYALDNGATPNRALDADNPWSPPAAHDFTKKLWEKLSFNPFQDDIGEFEGLSSGDLRVRHASTKVVGDKLHVFYSRRGDLMENVQMSIIDLSVNDWTKWDATYPPATLLMAQPGWEGGDITAKKSETASAPENVNQLRDPYIFTDSDGSMYLIYTGRGEDALGLASLSNAHLKVNTLNPIKDAYVKAGNSSDINYGSNAELLVSQKANQDLSQAYLNFDLSEVNEVDKTIVRLYSNSAVSGSITVSETTNDWSETGITLNNAPAVETFIATTQVETAKQYYEWNITPFIKSKLGSTASIVFGHNSINGETIKFDSKEGNNAPELLLITSSTEYIMTPIKPSSLNASAISTSEINLNWFDYAFNEDGYKVERKEGDGAFVEIAVLDAGSSSFKDIGLTDLTSYTYRVIAFNNEGNSNYSNEAEVTTLSANSEIITYFVNEDSYVRGGDSENANFGSDVNLIVKTGSKVEFFRKCLVKFDLSNETIKADHVARAVLRLYANKAKSCNITAFESDDNWSETSVTWANAPDLGNEIVETKVSSADNYYEWDVTGFLKAELANDKIISLMLDDMDANNEVIQFNSKEVGENIPELVVTTIGSTTNISSEFNFEKQVINIYPNPVTHVLNVKASVGIINKLVIFDLSGRIMYSWVGTLNQSQINTDHFNDGIYFLKAETDMGIYTMKFIKQNK